jgi:threonine aldolase
VGSVLCGSSEFIKKARRWRKVLGGGMRQAGIIAAAGIVALEQHIDRLAEDHANAGLLAEGLVQLDDVEVDLATVQTNMVFMTLRRGRPAALVEYLKRHGILIDGADRLRLVTHLDVTTADIKATVEKVKDFFAGELT